jgi:hypothetical protein
MPSEICIGKNLKSGDYLGMRLNHFAYLLTALLLAATTYLAWQGQQAARDARLKVAELEKQQQAQQAANPAAESLIEVPMPKPAGPTQPTPPLQATTTPSPLQSAPAPAASAATVEPMAPQAPNVPSPSSLAASQAPEIPGGGLTRDRIQAITDSARAGSLPKAVELTPAQKRVIAARPLAKIKAVVTDQGFAVLDGGSQTGLKQGQLLAVRRGHSILGKLRVSDSVEPKEAIADLDIASVPPGVKLEVGDEVIEIINP